MSNDNKLLEQPVKHLSPKRKSIDVGSISSENLDKETAYLLGVYLTDGSISKGETTFKQSKKKYKFYSFSLSAIDKEFVEFTLKCIKKLNPECNANVKLRTAIPRVWEHGKYISPCKDQWAIHVGFTDFAEWFKSQTGDKHHIPYVIWDAPLVIKRWFIAGLMDGDGYITYHTRSDQSIQWTVGIGGVEEGWVYEFQQLLHLMGLSTHKPQISIKDRKKLFVSFNIKIMDFVSAGLFFTILRKQERLKTYIKKRSETRRYPS